MFWAQVFRHTGLFGRAALIDLSVLIFLCIGVAYTGVVKAAPRGIDTRLHRAYLSTQSFGQLHYWSIGDGPVVIMLHQSAQSSAEFAAIGPLLATDFRVLAIDLPGHGQSDTPPHELTMDEYGDSVVAVMDLLSIGRAHLVGQHGGATVAINVTLRFPDRVNKVVLSGAGRDEHIDVEKLINTPMTRDLPVDADGEFLGKTWGVYRNMSASDTPPEVSFHPFLIALQQRQRIYDMHYAAYRWDYLPLLEGFSRPAMLLEADEDVFAGDVKTMQERIPGSIYRRVRGGGGSWQFYEKPAEHAAAISEFLR